jgi:hypothetical protein
MDEECSTHGEMRNEYRILVGKLEEMRPRIRTRRRWEDNIEVTLGKWSWRV